MAQFGPKHLARIRPKRLARFEPKYPKTAIDSKQQKIVLIDGKQLASLAIEYNLGVQVDKTIEIKKIDLDYFEEEI